MADLDLTAAVDAAETALRSSTISEGLTFRGRVDLHEAAAIVAVRAAAPLIEAAVREKVVRELQHAAASVPREESYPDYTLAGGLAHAARIVRGEA